MLRVSYCDCAVCVVRRQFFALCTLYRGHICTQIIMKLGQNVCFDKVSEGFENGSCWV